MCGPYRENAKEPEKKMRKPFHLGRFVEKCLIDFVNYYPFKGPGIGITAILFVFGSIFFYVATHKPKEIETIEKYEKNYECLEEREYEIGALAKDCFNEGWRSANYCRLQAEIIFGCATKEEEK